MTTARNTLLITFLAFQLLLPLRGFVRDRFESRGNFSWNMYSETYTCRLKYEMLTPDGATRTRDQVLGGVRGGHPGGDGASSAEVTRFEIRNHRHRHTFGEVAVVTYEEWQTRGDSSQGRVATAVFQAAPAAPNGVVWLHLHETMLPGA